MTPLARLKKKAVDLAIAKKLEKTPLCEGCGARASTAHHIIRQANSNYLRLAQENLVSTCRECHHLAHTRGDLVAFGQVFIKRGKKWHAKLIQDSHKMIRDNMGYWKEQIENLK